MIAATVSESDNPQNGESENQAKLDALSELVELNSGQFSLVLVRYELPGQVQEVLDRLHGLRDRNVVTVSLAPPSPDRAHSFNVLEELENLVRIESQGRTPDALVVLGYGTLLQDPRLEFGRLVQPLNLGRNLLVANFRYPLIFLLPPRAMALFLQAAPDLAGSRSTFFQLTADANKVLADAGEEVRKGIGWRARLQLRQLSKSHPEELQAEAKKLKTLIADAQAVNVDAAMNVDARILVAQLHQRLGWVELTLGDRLQAQAAFAEMLRLAQEKQDHNLEQAAVKAQVKARDVRPRYERGGAAKVIPSVFHGAAPLTASDVLIGRANDLERFVDRVQSVGCRFLSLSGEVACGKTSLVQAGLVPRLQETSRYHVVVVSRWDQPHNAIQKGLAPAAGSSFDESQTIAYCIAQVVQATRKTVVVVCDQFEELFTRLPQRLDRLPLERAIGDCVRQPQLACKFIFVIRQDAMNMLAEFDEYVGGALEEDKRVYLPPLSITDALVVLREMASAAKLGWTDELLRMIVKDLAREGQVRPLDLQLVAASLMLGGIRSDLDYKRVGGALSLLNDYLELVLTNLASQYSSGHQLAVKPPIWRWLAGPLNAGLGAILPAFSPSAEYIRDLKRLLVSLIDEPAKRLTLSVSEIALYARLPEKIAHERLKELASGHIVHSVKDEEASQSETTPQSPSASRYELTHDVVMDQVLASAPDLRDKIRRANKVLRHALEDIVAYPHRTISERDWTLITQYADGKEIARPQAVSLLDRSRRWFVARTIGLVMGSFAIFAVLSMVQINSSYLDVKHDYADRIVVRSGLPQLWFLRPVGDEVVLDTGFVTEDLSGLGAKSIDRSVQWQRDKRSAVLQSDRFVAALASEVRRGKLWCQVGQESRGIRVLKDELEKRDAATWQDALMALVEVAYADPKQGTKVLEILIPLMKDPRPTVRATAVDAVGNAAAVSPSVNALDEMLRLLKDPDGSVRASACNALTKVAVPAGVAGEVLRSLLPLLKDHEARVRGTAALAVGQLGAGARAGETLSNLLPLLQDNNSVVRAAAAQAVEQLAAGSDAREALPKVLPLLQDNDSLVRATAAAAIGRLAAGSDAREALPKLLPLLHDNSSRVRTDAAEAIERLAAADHELAGEFLSELLLLRKHSEPSIRASAAWALARVGDKGHAATLPELLPLLKDFDASVRQDAATAVGSTMAMSDIGECQEALQALLPLLQDRDPDTRAAAARAIGSIAQVNPSLQTQVFQQLTDRLPPSARSALRTPLAELLLHMAGDRIPPDQFLFDILDGKSSLVDKKNANSYAVYRNLAVDALSRWLASRKPEWEKVRSELEKRRQSHEIHLRIAAWDALANVVHQ